jgi:hypothetical protein
MDVIKPYQVVIIDELRINDAQHMNCRAFFIRYIKNEKCQVQVNGTLIILPLSKVRKATDNKI